MGKTGVFSANYKREFSEQTLKNMSAAQKKRLSNPENHPLYGTYCSELTKKKISDTLLKRKSL
jgi:hypothetical protein